MKFFLLALITFYQKIISPVLHQLLGIKEGCRNNPSCSVYAKEVVSKYGARKGLLLTSRRLLNCQPFFSL